jgi:hypothetical protein
MKESLIYIESSENERLAYQRAKELLETSEIQEELLADFLTNKNNSFRETIISALIDIKYKICSERMENILNEIILDKTEDLGLRFNCIFVVCQSLNMSEIETAAEEIISKTGSNDQDWVNEIRKIVAMFITLSRNFQ